MANDYTKQPNHIDFTPTKVPYLSPPSPTTQNAVTAANPPDRPAKDTKNPVLKAPEAGPFTDPVGDGTHPAVMRG